MQVPYWPSSLGRHSRLLDWSSDLRTLSMLGLAILVKALYGVVYSNPAGAQHHFGIAATHLGSVHKVLMFMHIKVE